MEDLATCDRGEAFLSRVLPNVYFSEFNLSKAAQQEEDAQVSFASPSKLAPPPDPEMLGIFALRYSPSMPFSMTGFIREIHQHRGEMEPLVKDTSSRIANQLMAQRADAAFVLKARNTEVC